MVAVKSETIEFVNGGERIDHTLITKLLTVDESVVDSTISLLRIRLQRELLGKEEELLGTNFVVSYNGERVK